MYVENRSKNHPGTFGDKQSHEVVTLYSQSDAVPKCVVYLIVLFFSKFPKPPENIPFFYLKPVGKVPAKDEVPWFYEDAQIVDKKISHSLRATGATAMFGAGVSEKLVKNVTGYKSSGALQVYQHPTRQQEMTVSKFSHLVSNMYHSSHSRRHNASLCSLLI